MTPVKVNARPSWTAGSREVRGGGPVTWPAAAAATVDLAAAARAAGSRSAVRVRAGVSPVYVAPAAPPAGVDVPRAGRPVPGDVDRVTVRVHDRAAAI
ncbi:MAG TPA: hypothetical protein VFR67_29350, partial [Pilimelia sp.]|nr:hypothetical protein [Pilimelia sp.]